MTRSILLRLNLLLGCAALSVGPAALASESATGARQIFAQAETAYRLGRFEEAIGSYSRAYELSAHPELLFNIAQCHRHLEQHRQAAFFYERFLVLASRNAPSRPLARKLLAEVTARAEQQERVLGASTPADEPRRALDLAPPPLPPPDAVTGALGTGPSAAAEASPPLYRRWWFWTAVGTGIAAGAAATFAASERRPTATLGEIRFPEGATR
jgi:tetratricopeptide (TPR) repeat protein